MSQSSGESGPHIAIAREPRVVVACEVQVYWRGDPIWGVSQDISKKGIFVRADRFLPVGDETQLFIRFRTSAIPPAPAADARASNLSFDLQADDEWVIDLPARVVHVLGEAAANSLGRQPGMGLAFLDEPSEARARLEEYLEDVMPVLSIRPDPAPRRARVLLADGSTRLLERLSVALGNAGFVVATVANGAEAYANCLHDPPDVLLVAADMPVVDGWRLIRMLGARPELARIPVALMSDEADDLTRLRAYRLGVVDFIPKPFTAAELCIRMRLLVRKHSAPTSLVVLRGDLSEIGATTLLGMLEFERKSGVLSVMRDTEVAWLTVDGGRVVKAESAGDRRGSLDNAIMVLGWDRGEFEFVGCEVVEDDEIGLSTTHLVLEAARRHDEETRPMESVEMGADGRDSFLPFDPRS
ncbi:MAG: response regulator [Polyangiaceae bacterium]